MIRRIIAALICAVLSLSLCSCVKAPLSSETKLEIALPEPAEETVNMFLGEHFTAEPESVMLHYVSADSTSFTTVTRSVILSPGENIYEEAVVALLNTSGVPDRTALMPAGTKLLSVEFSQGIVTVNLSLDAYGVQNEQEYLMLMASIVNTLLSIEKVEGVNLLIDGRAEDIAGLPMGIQTQPFTGITPEYAQLSAERDYFLESATGTIVREAALYFPVHEDDWFISETREISFDSDNYAAALIRALRSGPRHAGCAIATMPEGADLLVDNPVFEMSSSGDRVLRFDFSSTLLNYLAFAGMEEWKLIGSVVLTACSFVPGSDAVRIYIDGQMLTHYSIGENEISLSDGLIRRSDFVPYIGSTTRIYAPTENGTLEAIERADSMARIESPQSLLDALMDDFSSNVYLPPMFTQGINHDDILGISVENGIASVNLSANFYRLAQALDAASERSVIYAVVNTLCESDEISGVRFYIEGISAETLSGNVYLKSILLPNPGLIAFDNTGAPEFTAIP